MLAMDWLKTLPLPTAAAVVLLAIAFGTGRAALRPLKLRTTAPGAGPLVELAFGLGILATGAYLVGAIGCFGRNPLRLLALVAAIVALSGVRTNRSAHAESSNPWRNVDLIVGGALFVFGFAYAALPPYFYDALVYHLALPARYLASGSIAPPPDMALAGYPQNAEVLSAIAMSLGGESAAQILNYLIAWSGIAGLWWFLRSTTSRLAASVGVLIVVAPWPFWFISTCCKNDLLGAIFLLGAFVVLAGGGNDIVRRATLAGCLAGFGVGTKYPNALGAAALLLAVPYIAERGKRARAVAAFALALTIAAAPWPARNAIYFKNPVYPILGQRLGSPPMSALGASRMSVETGQAMDRTPVAILRRLAALGVDEAAFGWGSKISPILLPAMILGAIATRRRDLRVGLALGAVVLIVGLSFLTAYVRTFAFAWCLGALAPAALLGSARTRLMKALALSLFGLAVVAAIVTVPLQFEQYSARGSRVFFGSETPAAFGERQANYLPLALGPMRALPDKSLILVVGSTRAAFLPRTAEWSYVWDEPPLKSLFATAMTPERAIFELRGRGITHLLVNGPEMARNERLYNWLGLRDEAMREWFSGLAGRLTLVAKANDCYLYALP